MNLKFNELVSKVIVEGKNDDSIVKSILSWLKKTEPEVIVKKRGK